MGRLAIVLAVFASGCRIGFDETRVANVDAMTTIDVPDRPNRAFLTASARSGDLGGIAGADAMCQQEATQAGLEGTFVAFLRSGTTSPVDRLAGSRGWIDLANTPIVDAPEGWLIGRMFHPLRVDSTKAIVGYVGAWLGTVASGTCDDWTLTTGNAGVVTATSSYNEFTFSACTAPHRIACLEVGHVAQVSPPTTQGRLAFLSSPWVPAGIAAADQLCASEATAAGLAGSFLALLTTTTTDGFARFSVTGPTWTRVDGIALAPSAAAVAGVDDLDSFTILHADATANYSSAPNTWMGSSASNCSDWKLTSGMGVSGDAGTVTRNAWRSVIDAPCTNARRLICLQE